MPQPPYLEDPPGHRPPRTPWQKWRRRLVAVGTVAAALWWYRYQPLTKAEVASAAARCLQGYELAATAADTAQMDARTWMASRRKGRKLPSCGELRRRGKLYPPEEEP